VHYGTVAGIIAALQRSLLSHSIERGWLVGLCALISYAAFASPYIVDGDNAEFAALGALGGRAHPSGYPLYVLWLRAWSWLPGTPAHAAALATALLGALTIAVLHAACRAWGARPLAATIAVAVIAAAPIAIRYHCEAEVFALNNLVAALILWLAASRGPLRGRWRAAALGLCAGLGLANHLTCALLAPVGICGVVRAARESRATSYGLAALGLAIGAAPYGYLFVADGPASWGSVRSLSELIATITRREYGGATSFMPGAALPWSVNVAACAATIARSWLWVGAIAGLAMLGIRIWRPRGESRGSWAMLAASIALTGPVLASRFNVDPHGIGLYVCQRFHVLPALLLAIPVAAALDLACARIARPGLATALAVLGFAALSVSALPQLARVHSPAMELGVQNLLRSLPPDAIAVVQSEDQCFGGRYLQLARGERPDVAFVCSELLWRDWYRAGWAKRGLALPSDPGPPLGAALVGTGRPVLVDRGLSALLAAFPSYPYGVLHRVLPVGTAPPPASEVAVINRELYRGFELDYDRPGRDDDFAAVAHRRYAAAWAAIENLLDAAGDHAAARDAHEVARSLQPVQPDRPAPPAPPTQPAQPAQNER
jgi:hypothetical protein